MSSVKKQIALFGGSFDPVHFGHLIVARAVAEEFGFQRITLVPAASPPHKQGTFSSPEHRLAMLQLAIKDDPLFEICRLELYRTGPSYTFDTLQGLLGEHGPECQLSWIIGLDMLEELHKWHRYREVVDLAQIIVAARPPWQEQVKKLLKGLSKHFSDDQVEAITGSVIPTPLIDISSSLIRSRIAGKKPIRYLVPYNVMSYIEENKLYGWTPPLSEVLQ